MDEIDSILINPKLDVEEIVKETISKPKHVKITKEEIEKIKQQIKDFKSPDKKYMNEFFTLLDSYVEGAKQPEENNNDRFWEK